MSASRVILKKTLQIKLLTWIGDALGGTMGTRHARVTWDTLQDKRSSSGRKLKLQVKVSPGESNEFICSRLKEESSPVKQNVERTNVFQKTFDQDDDAKLMLRDILKTSWDVTDNSSRKFKFTRASPDIANDRLIVEFGSPNIAKPMHMGHLRSFVTGHFVARICNAVGHDVTTICFLGDWGTQFGVLQAGLAKWNPENQNVLQTVKNLQLDELLNYYIRSVKEKETDKEFFAAALKCSSDLEKGDKEAVEIWKLIREKTVNHLKSFWSQFNVKYDVIQGESDFTVNSLHTEKALKLLTDLGVTETGDDNCIYAVLPPDKKFASVQKVALVKKDGSSLYLLRDIACALSRLEKFQYNKMLYVVDKSQAHHFIALFRLLEMLKVQENMYHADDWEKKLRHVTFGKVEGMSTRSGNFVLLSDVIRDGSRIMQENRNKSPNTRNEKDSSISTKLAISALIVHYLKVRRNRDMKFDWNEALRPNGETGVNLQYTHARLFSLERKTLIDPSIKVDPSEFDLDYILNDSTALELAIQIANFEDAFWASYSELEPCILLSYLFRLSDKVSKSLKLLKVQGEPNNRIASTRLMLFMLSRRILAIGLQTVAIEPLDEM